MSFLGPDGFKLKYHPDLAKGSSEKNVYGGGPSRIFHFSSAYGVRAVNNQYNFVVVQQFDEKYL